MKEFKGTPGPWQMKKEKGEQEWFVFQKGSMKKLYGGTVRTPVAEEINNKHDANLIAAAPELLEVVTATGDEIGHWLSQQKPELKEKIDAAIAKALGGNQS